MNGIIIILGLIFGGYIYSMDDVPLYYKATFTLTHECKQVKKSGEVCVDLTSGKTALYAPKQ
tara:strand:+ start:1949 stop:2134 length:186 start_codon:yes stop_codon:yes gene_type:complete